MCVQRLNTSSTTCKTSWWTK